ncbi:hypothetical protein D8674_003999 [Pyrus ussuriensis x Pyrus communis]|uniref:Uncharacterized protein n=1 Tax=Pyrus ussuriensis x Pyrus communis TaxID=2448454 RepID=A0A5N5FXH8_9ROSA|nr:hypothetical protein D8674_003999 [Pyrus ussuriensis x Pyrus communis]
MRGLIFAESEQSRESTLYNHKEWQDAWDEGDKIEVEKQGLDKHGEFWEKLKLIAERKVCPYSSLIFLIFMDMWRLYFLHNMII